MLHWKDRVKAASIHLGISLGIAALAAAPAAWAATPADWAKYGLQSKKPRKELRRDLAVVGLIQLAALGYGMTTVFAARPVHLVFEFNRFRVVHAVDVPSDLMDKVPAGIEAMPLLGPTPLALRPFKDAKEEADATLVALQGISLSARPDLWQDYAAGKAQVLAAAKPVQALKVRFPERAAAIDAVLGRAGRQADSTVYLPMTGRKSFWTAFIDPGSAAVVAFMPLDSF